MSQSTTREAVRSTPRTGGTLQALRAIAVLATLNVLYQAATAGQILMPESEDAEEWHGGGAIALHVLTGLLTLAAIWYARSSRAPWWPAVLSVVVFAATFVEASLGQGSSLWIHVPLALVLTIGIVWVTAWTFTRSATTPR
jgi:hypothetical protein